MGKAVLVLSLMSMVTLCVGQPCPLLTGVVLEKTTGEPLPGANVRLVSNWRIGTSTGVDGKFSLAVAKDTLLVSFVGYKSAKIPIREGSPCDLRLELAPDSKTMGEVVVRAERLIAEEFKTTGINKLQIYLNPSAKADPLLAVNSLPSATTLDESANVSLRGSTAAETGIYLNNVPLYDAVRYSQLNGIGTFSIFNTAIIDKVQVFPGNPPMEYGNTSSGLIAMQSDSRVPEGPATQVSLTLASFGINTQAALGKKAALHAFSNYQPSALIKGLNGDALASLKAFNSNDLGLHVVWNLGPDARIKVFNYSLAESYTFLYRAPTFEGDFMQKKKRNFTVANFQKRFGNTELTINQGASFSLARYGFSNTAIKLSLQDYYTSVNLQRFGRNVDVKTGISYDRRSSQFNGQYPEFDYAIGPSHPVMSSVADDILPLAEVFGYLKYTPVTKVVTGIGARLNIPAASQPSYASYQGNLKYFFSEKINIVLSGGQYHRYDFGRNADAELLTSRQLSADFSVTHNRYEFALSGFHKRITATEEISNVDGGEIYAKYSKGRKLQAQLSLTSLRAKNSSNGIVYSSAYDLRYFVRGNVQVGFASNWMVNTVFLLRQGSFYTPVDHAVYDQQLDAFEPFYFSIDSQKRLPDYGIVNLNLSKLIPFGRQFTAVTFLGINNLFNRENIRDYAYSFDYSAKQPELFSKRTIYLGIILNF